MPHLFSIVNQIVSPELTIRNPFIHHSIDAYARIGILWWYDLGVEVID